MSEKTMNYFDDTKVTAKGLELITRLMGAGEPLHFTRAVICDGISDSDNVNMTEVTHEVPSHNSAETGTSAIVDMISINTEDKNVYVRVKVQNGDTEFILRKIVIMAEDQNGNEIPYAYTYDNSKYAMLFPSTAHGKHMSATVDISFFVSGLENITANITLAPEVTREEFATFKAEYENNMPSIKAAVEKLEDTKHLACMRIKYMVTEGQNNYVTKISVSINGELLFDDTITVKRTPGQYDGPSALAIKYNYNNNEVTTESLVGNTAAFDYDEDIAWKTSLTAAEKDTYKTIVLYVYPNSNGYANV